MKSLNMETAMSKDSYNYMKQMFAFKAFYLTPNDSPSKIMKYDFYFI